MSLSIGSHIAGAIASIGKSVDSAATETPHPATTLGPSPPPIMPNGQPTPPPIKPDSLASFVPADGLHPIAGGQATATAKESGGKGVAGLFHDLQNMADTGGVTEHLSLNFSRPELAS